MANQTPSDKIDLETALNDILDELRELPTIRTADIPHIDLYMDQVTTFMEEHLTDYRRNDEDKILTKTMINNYTKNHLLPSPEKKKYSREHMLILIFIYYFKSVLSLQDIQSLLTPLTDQYFKQDTTIDLEAIYNEIFSHTDQWFDLIAKDTRSYADSALGAFDDAPNEERAFASYFTLISTLCLDIYIKKKVMEKLIDKEISLFEPSQATKGSPSDEEHAKPIKSSRKQKGTA